MKKQGLCNASEIAVCFFPKEGGFKRFTDHLSLWNSYSGTGHCYPLNLQNYVGYFFTYIWNKYMWINEAMLITTRNSSHHGPNVRWSRFSVSQDKVSPKADVVWGSLRDQGSVSFFCPGEIGVVGLGHTSDIKTSQGKANSPSLNNVCSPLSPPLSLPHDSCPSEQTRVTLVCCSQR